MKNRTLWITQTAVLLALVVVVQAFTTSFGNTFITGSLVNLILILGVGLVGLWGGLSVALLSPIFAFFFKIGPTMWQLILCIAIGNAVLVLVWWFVLGTHGYNQYPRLIGATIAGAVAKFLTLYLLIVKLMVPLILQLPEPQASVVSATFSYPQLVTALLGGTMAVLLMPQLRKILGLKIKV
ncbi:ECF transporter S component [Enterococcus sp. 2201sp1_2201st1_B8_2201SCRN_220225]|uniref:ECF transporter S component n=1 Tax=unclassified Enterococcus TaxID=2608891 RepID=UPI0034A3B199